MSGNSQNNSTVAMHLDREVKGQDLAQRPRHRRNLRARLNTITVSVLIGITRSKPGRLLTALRIATFQGKGRKEKSEKYRLGSLREELIVISGLL